MLRALYGLLFTLALPLVFVRLWIKGWKTPGYRHRWLERLGIFKAPTFSSPPLWMHAVSMGESISAIPLVEAFIQQNPEVPVVFTTMTPTASEQIAKRLKDKVFHVYLPYDTPWTVKQFLKRINPRLLVILETELWPQIIHQCSKNNIPVMMANARLTDRSTGQYKKIKALMRPLFKQITFIGSQSQQDTERFLKIGATSEQITFTGNLKYDLNLPANIQDKAMQCRQTFGSERPVWLAASTHPGEEIQVLKAHKALLEVYPNALLVLVPRHPNRFDGVNEEINNIGFRCARRSKSEPCLPETQVYLGDTMGELLMLYAASDMAFVGGSLVPVGGHNPLEPAALKKPVIMGSHTQNCEAIVVDLKNIGGLEQVDGAEALAKKLIEWVGQPTQAAQVGAKAQALVQANKGAIQKLLNVINQLAF